MAYHHLSVSYHVILVITPRLSCFCSTQWNKIEHRLFCHITQNWRGRPLESRTAVVELIAATKTKTGLKVECVLDERTYEKGIKVSDAEMDALDIRGDTFILGSFEQFVGQNDRLFPPSSV